MQRASLGRAVLVSLLALFIGCAGHLTHGVFVKGETRYRIGEIPASWQVLRMQENDVALMSKDSPHSLSVNATCSDHQDSSLEVLTRHLLMGFTERATVSEVKGMLDGRESLRTHVIARLDGVPVEFILVVMKKDGCVYDFTYISPVGRLEERVAEFEKILENFKTVARS